MNALTIIALLLAAPGSGQPSMQNGGKLPSGGLDFNEFTIDTGMAYIRTDQNRPNAAFNGDEYVVVWHDERRYDSPGDILAARISATGTILDPHGFPVCTEAYGQRFPAVACVDSVTLAVWYDLRSDNAGDIFYARIANNGEVLEPDGLVLCDATAGQEYPAVAGGDTSWLAVWQDKRHSSYSIYGARIGRSGQVLDPTAIAIAYGTGNMQLPAVSFNGTGFLVVWQTDQYGPSMVWGAYIAPDGRVKEPGGFPIAGDMSQRMTAVEPSVASDGQQFLVTWENDSNSRGIYCRTVSGDGGTLGPVSCLSSGLIGYRPTTAWDGTQYQVLWDSAAWLHKGDIRGARVDRTGSPRGPCYTVTTEQGTQAFAGISGGYLQSLAVWESDPYDEELSQLRATRLDTSGVVLDTTLAAPWGVLTYGLQVSASIAVLDSQYLLTWASRDPLSDSEFGYDICGARLDQDGRMLDSIAIPISVCVAGQWTPAVAAGDSNYFVAWSDGRWYWPYPKLYGTMVTRSGTVLNPDGIVISNGPGIACTNPAIAFDGTNYLVAWAESKNIYGARVTQSGTVLDRIPITTTSSDEKNPAVAFDGTNYLVTWQSAAVQYQDVIRGARVTTEGVVLDSNGFLINGSRSWDPAVAYNGTNYLVVWVDYRTTWWEIFGTRISPAGEVLDTAGITVSRWGYEPWYESDPCVASDGSNFVVPWKSAYDETDLRGAVISADGVRTDTFVLSAMPVNSPSPACAYGRDGRFLAVFSAVENPNGGGRDTLARIGGSFVSPDIGLSEATKETRGRAALSINPNPFTRAVRFQLGPRCARPGVHLTICDAAGRCVRTFTCAQNGVLNWDGTDVARHRLPAGIYFCTLKSGGIIVRQKLTKLE